VTYQEQVRLLQAENARPQRQLSLASVAQLTRADFPNQDEIDQLLRLVEAAYPNLKYPHVTEVLIAEHRDQFCRAIMYLCYASRSREPQIKYGATFWIDNCSQWLRDQAYETTMTLRPFCAAIVASGVAFSPLTRYPFDMAFALALGTVSQPSSAWRDVLRDGVPEPVEPKVPFITLQPHTARLQVLEPETIS
jgi:hypothetical protein